VEIGEWSGREDEVESAGVLRIGIGVEGDVDLAGDGTAGEGDGDLLNI
jgi:hypothetical protein